MFIGRTDAEDEALILWAPDIKADSLEKTQMLRKMESKRRRRQQRMRGLDSVTDPIDMSLNKLWARVEDRGPFMLQPMGSQRVGHDLTTEPQPQEGGRG